jgi:purine-nucleoside phosphorylase
MEREIHIRPMDLLMAMQYKPGDLAGIALVSGQPQRVSMALEKLENPMRNFSAFGYTLWTGDYKGKRVTVGNGGFYAPDSALMTDLLCAAGVKYFLRLGSCGGMREDIQIGDYVLAESALRGDGVTTYYVDDGFTPSADKELSETVAGAFNNEPHRGMVWTTDALLRETKEVVNNAIDKGAIAVDMVTSPLLTIAHMNNRKATAVLVVSDNLITGEMGFASVRVFDAEKRMVDCAFDVIEKLDV